MKPTETARDGVLAELARFTLMLGRLSLAENRDFIRGERRGINANTMGDGSRTPRSSIAPIGPSVFRPLPENDVALARDALPGARI